LDYLRRRREKAEAEISISHKCDSLATCKTEWGGLYVRAADILRLPG
jgi:hypothetical protein